MRDKFRKYSLPLAIILIIVGAALLCAQPAKNHLVKHSQNKAYARVTQMAKTKQGKKIASQNAKKPGNFDFKSVKEINVTQALRAQNETPQSFGAIAVPAVGLKLPINKGLSEINMSTGACTMRSDQQMGQGNYPLAGHYMLNNGAILFSPVANIQVGNKIYITNFDKVYVYQAYSKKIVSPHAVYLVNDTKEPIITLITCADGGTMRWAVRGKLVDTYSYNGGNF